MLPILFDESKRVFQTFGIGVLSDAISCEVEENRNGAYELEMKYPITGAHYESIALRAIIVAKPNYTDAPQPFRIYNISKPINGVVTVSAQHISYDLSGCVADPFLAAGVTEAMARLKTAATGGGQSDFVFSSNMTTVKTMEAKHPESVRALMGGTAGSALDLYGGEWHFDGYECTLLASRGENRGAVVSYGKNLTDLKQEENNAAVYTAIYPYYYNQDTETLVVLPEKTLAASGTYSYTRTLPLDLTMEFQEAPTVAELRTAATAYIASHQIGVPKVNLTIKFVAPDSFQERIDLCDQVSVYFEKLGVSASAKCIRTKWDVLKGRYIEAELGDARNSLAATIAKTTEIATAIQEKTSQFRAVADHVAGKVTGNKGGYIVLHDTNNDGEPDELLIMDNASISSAVKIIRINNAGIAFSRNGYAGPYATAWNIDGEFVADFIASGTLKTQNVQILGDTQFYWDEANITIVDPSDTNKMIRFGKYDGSNYGLGFSIDGGVTWKSGFNFSGLTIYGMTSNADRSNFYIGGGVLRALNGDGYSVFFIGETNVRDETPAEVTGECYRIGTYYIPDAYTPKLPGLYSIAMGKQTSPIGAYSIVIGYQAKAIENAVAIGRSANALSNSGIAIGYGAKTTQGTSATGAGIAIGKDTEAKGDGSITIGLECVTPRQGTTIGRRNTVSCEGCITIGAANTVTLADLVIGENNTINGNRSIALGLGNNATNSGALLLGSSNSATGSNAVALGSSHEISGKNGLALGYNNEASGEKSTAIGVDSVSSGYGSVAIGAGVTAAANGSVALGWNNTANFERSVAVGLGNTTNRLSQFLCGAYAAPQNNDMFVVGLGTETTGANLLRLTAAGNLWIKGTLSQGSDRRLKDIIKEALPDLSSVRAVKFKWKEKPEEAAEDVEHIGYIAQDVEEIAPFLVSTDNKGIKSLDYIGLLCAKVERLENLVERMANRIGELEAMLA